MASIAARVEIGEAQLAGVARSSRAGTKRSVNAGPAMRGWPGFSGAAPRIQTLRRPFFNSTVVTVAVETRMALSMVLASMVMSGFPEMLGSSGFRTSRPTA